MSAARLRTAFQYPTDEMDDLPPHIDEEEQEAIIHTLRAADASQTALYSNLFTGIFTLPTIYSLLCIFTSPSLLNFLSLSSFLITLYTMKFIPVDGNEVLDDGGFIRAASSGGPIQRLLPVLNGILAAVVGWGTFVENLKLVNDQLFGRIIMGSWVGYLPLAIWITSVIVRYVMKPLDLTELERMRYKYKGV